MYRHLPPSAFRNPPTAQGLLEVPEVHLLDRQFHGCINTPENLEELDRMDWDLTLKAGHPFKWQHLLTTKLRMFPCQAYEKNEELDWDIVKYSGELWSLMRRTGMLMLSAARLAAIAVETVLMKEHTRARQTAVDNGGRNQAPVLQGNRQRSSYQSMRDHQPTIQELKEQAFNKAEDVFLTVLRDLFSFKVTRRPDGTETAFRSFTVGEVANFPIRLSILFQVQNMVRLFRNGFASLPHEQQSRVLHGEELQLPMEPEEMMRIPHPLGAEDLERRRKRQIRTEEEIEEGLHESWEEPAAERREYVRLVRFAFALARQAKIYNPSEDVHDYERIYQTEVLMDDVSISLSQARKKANKGFRPSELNQWPPSDIRMQICGHKSSLTLQEA